MRYDKTLNHSAGWTAEDLAEPPGPKRAEDDPWEMPSAAAETASDSSASSPPAKEEAALPTPDEPSEIDSVDGVDVDEEDADYWDDVQFGDVEPHDRATLVELSALLMWDTVQFNGAGPASHEAIAETEVDGSYLLGTLPLAEYDGELGQPLYELDYDIPDLPGAVQVDQWVASIDEISDAEARETAELLRDFSRQRLRRWLPWLRGQQWSGQSLLRFLQFRAYWDENPELWEASFWDARIRCWQPTWSRYNLSRDNQFDLVRQRMDCPAAEIINKAWLDDWQTFALWGQGYESFADFALFRAGLADSEDWRSYVDRFQYGDSAESSQESEDVRSDDPLKAQLHHKFRQVFWFDEQDWYDPVEWHDGLGW